MKHFVLVGLLVLSLGVAGCVGYRPATSPYYTTYYNTFDATRNCYYHTRYCSGCSYGYVGGGHGRNRWHPGGGGHEHHSSGGSSHSGSSGHSHGSSHSHSGSSHSGGNHK